VGQREALDSGVVLKPSLVVSELWGVNAPPGPPGPFPNPSTTFLAQARSLSSPGAFVTFRDLLFLQDSRREAVVQASVVQDWEVDPSEIDMKKSIPIGKVRLLLRVKSRLLEGRFQLHGYNLVSSRCIILW
jgi:hypothetical protein